MTTAILLGGLVVLAALGVAMVRPAWRLPALAFGLLAIPGNVDNLPPQMTLDAHSIPSATAPAISVIDLLIGWAVALTVIERRRPVPVALAIIGLAIGLSAIAAVTAAAALGVGVEPLAVVRGTLLFARIPALLYLGSVLGLQSGLATRLGAALVAGGVVLLANGTYTTVTSDLGRFTASTFGRNGLAVTLIIIVVVSTALAYGWWGRSQGRRRPNQVAAGIAVMASAVALFGAIATGTRMGLVVLIGAAAVAVVASPTRLRWTGLAGGAVTATAATLVLVASVLGTAAGARTVSIVTDPSTVGAVDDPVTAPTGSEIRTRQEFWRLAVEMWRSRPLSGVGPFQWNIDRYDLDPGSPVVVADPHNSYLQVLAEYGVVTAVAYAVVIGSVCGTVVWLLRRRSTRRRLGWHGVGIAVAGVILPAADVANSHLFNVRNGALEWLILGAALGLATSVRGSEGDAAVPPPG